MPTLADKVEPISLAPIVYRLWAAERVAEYSDKLGAAFALMQGGGTGTLDCQGLLLELQEGDDFRSRQYGGSLDFAKCFDSTDATLAARLLEKWGLPKRTGGLVLAMWLAHRRWVSFGGAVCPSPIQNCQVLPQGDPWAPWGLAAVLRAPHMAADEKVPGVKAILLADDRTGRAHTLADLRDGVRFWDRFGNVTDLASNAKKRQVYGGSRPKRKRTWKKLGGPRRRQMRRASVGRGSSVPGGAN